MKNHLKRIAASRNWKLVKKENKFVTKPNPGTHAQEYGFPLILALRDMLKIAETRIETRDILLHNEVLVDGVRRKDHRYCVGLMDTISIPKINKNYRVILDDKGKLGIVEIDENESKIKVEKIVGKVNVGKKIQVNLFDGRNILDDKNDYKVGDSVVIEVPSQKVLEHLKFEKKASILLTGGKHRGTVATVENIEKDKLVFKNLKGEIFETVKKHAYVIGKEKPHVKVK